MHFEIDDRYGIRNQKKGRRSAEEMKEKDAHRQGSGVWLTHLDINTNSRVSSNLYVLEKENRKQYIKIKNKNR